MSLIQSKAAIAARAEVAALEWITASRREGSAPKPKNPFDPLVAPDHHQAWRAAFERYLVAYSSEDAEVSA